MIFWVYLQNNAVKMGAPTKFISAVTSLNADELSTTDFDYMAIRSIENIPIQRPILFQL